MSASSGYRRVTSLPLRLNRRTVAGVDLDDGAHAVPLHLQRPAPARRRGPRRCRGWRAWATAASRRGARGRGGRAAPVGRAPRRARPPRGRRRARRLGGRRLGVVRWPRGRGAGAGAVVARPAGARRPGRRRLRGRAGRDRGGRARAAARRSRARAGSMRWMSHWFALLAAAPAGADERDLAGAPRPLRLEAAALLAVEDDDDLLALVPLAQLEGARVPDGHLPAAVLALRDGAGERAVLHRVVLGLDGEVVLRRVAWAPPWAAPSSRARRSWARRKSQCSRLAWCSWMTKVWAASAVVVEDLVRHRLGRLRRVAHGPVGGEPVQPPPGGDGVRDVSRHRRRLAARGGRGATSPRAWRAGCARRGRRRAPRRRRAAPPWGPRAGGRARAPRGTRGGAGRGPPAPPRCAGPRRSGAGARAASTGRWSSCCRCSATSRRAPCRGAAPSSCPRPRGPCGRPPSPGRARARGR